MKILALTCALLGAICLSAATDNTKNEAGPRPLVLTTTRLRDYVQKFNEQDRELYKQQIPNESAAAWLSANVPLFECPDEELEKTYYFRWWTYRKQIKKSPDGFVVTEFLPPVDWAGKHNTISCAAAHHLYEGRWLGDQQILDDYSVFWFRKGGEPRRYSFWVADSLWARYLVTGESAVARELLPDLVKNYEEWEKGHRDPNGLFWQVDDRDGMEVSISGARNPKGYRATINSYMFGDALAISKIAALTGQDELARRFQVKAEELQRLVQEQLWDAEAQFFKVRPRNPDSKLSDARELHGYTPWYFNLPDAAKSGAWKELMNPAGFYAPFGPTTAEQRHPGFAISYKGHECQWNGPSWPYATAVTLTALANLLNNYEQTAISRNDYLQMLKIYSQSHRLCREDGQVVPWIDENLNPTNGDWISRTRLKSWRNGTWDQGKGGEERGKDYNHSTFCDLVISGLVGLRPRPDDKVEVNPLVPEGAWDYFCLDQVRYHGCSLTILFDRTGARYNKGRGLRVFANGRQIAQAESLRRVTAALPGREQKKANAPAETTAGWMKYAGNPVMGGQYGTCFDVSVLKEADAYRMWLSWRPKASVALVESKDGIHWSAPPEIVLGPNPQTGWEADINRPVVVKRANSYHMWYTGQARGRSAIGYAISSDGITWRRLSDKPVLAPEQAWEKVAVMCPHVIWDQTMNRFRMWYSAGDQYEPDAIGYATSPDGRTWTKSASNPIFTPDTANAWEKAKVTAVQVIRQGDWHLMFYIGFRDVDHAQIGVARSKDGVSNWQRHPENPIIRPGLNQWDHDACYKPYAVFDGQKWLLWYNGRHKSLEQIGLVFHEGVELGFPAE